MEESRNPEDCTAFLRRLREKGKLLPDFRESVNSMQGEASTKGLDDAALQLMLEILRRLDLGSKNSVLLIKCMIPREKVCDTTAKRIITWLLSLSAPVTTLNLLLQWLIGCWEYQLIDRTSMYIFYDAFFFTMIKQEKLESRLAQLIYLITKPEDVTRRQVTRLLKLNERYGKPQKHVIALLSLFKSYKPEFVPEKIPAINIQCVWRPIPEVLRLGFEDARDRVTLQQTRQISEFNRNWTIFHANQGKKNQEPLVPSIGYFNIGSNIFNDKTEKSIFDISSYTQLGQYHFVIKLPHKATSLLTNSIGYHLLTFTDFAYQQRFMYNLYYTFWRSFIFEKGRYSVEEMNKILDMTTEFSKYMQHGITIVNYFINEYLSCYMDEHHARLLSLMQWSTVSTSELQDYVLKHMKLMFCSSSSSEKIQIIRTLRSLLVNLFVVNNNAFKDKSFPFLGQTFSGKLTENLQIIDQFSKSLITSALNANFCNSSMHSEALSYYEQIHMLGICDDKVHVNLAPSTVVYGSFITKSCALLSRVCSLLLQYRKSVKEYKDRTGIKSIKRLIVYAEDLVSALWYDNCFSNRLAINRYFLRSLSDGTIDSCQLSDINSLLNIRQHCAVLPHMCALSATGLHIKSKKDASSVAAQYYSYVNQFIIALLGN